MKIGRKWLGIMLLIALGALAAIIVGPTLADSGGTDIEIPQTINYQGYLTDDQGNPVDENKSITFKIYNEASEVWSETQPVAVSDGLFNVILGQSTPIELGSGSGQCYLGLTIDGEELTPRQPLVSVPFALRSDDADKLDGLDSDDFATETDIVDLQEENIALQSQIDDLQDQMSTLLSTLEGVSRDGDTLKFSGMNVQIDNGTGSTDGTVNSLGNLIVGYNELRGSGDNRTGSHNVIVGKRHNYSSYGGLVGGYQNTISGPYSSVTGGKYNEASGSYSSVTGGYKNTASGAWSSVTGG